MCGRRTMGVDAADCLVIEDDEVMSMTWNHSGVEDEVESQWPPRCRAMEHEEQRVCMRHSCEDQHA